MGLHLYSVHHADHGLAAVESVTPAVAGLGRRLVDDNPAVAGAVVLATCNRVEIYLDADESAAPHLSDAVRGALTSSLPELDAASVPLRARHANEVVWHLFGVGAGLDSMVVGEREIAGQLRRALKAARAEGTATYLLTESIEQALRTSRRVAHLTGLASNGRSVVAVGLDLLARDWASSRVLVLGTGAYAGAVTSALAARGCRDVTVHSASGRAAAFAASHGVRASAGDLAAALAEADAVVTCRGVGRFVLDVPAVQDALARRAGGLDVVDLALARDVDPAVADLPGVRLVDLATIQAHVPDASARERIRAEHLVAQGVEDLLVRLRGRQMDPAVIALRDNVSAMVDDEIARLPQGRPVTADEAAHALRRLAARLIHEPSVRARKAAEEGRGETYIAALQEIYGIHTHAGTQDGRVAVDPEKLEVEACPYAGYGLEDLGDGHAQRREAM